MYAPKISMADADAAHPAREAIPCCLTGSHLPKPISAPGKAPGTYYSKYRNGI